MTLSFCFNTEMVAYMNNSRSYEYDDNNLMLTRRVLRELLAFRRVRRDALLLFFFRPFSTNLFKVFSKKQKYFSKIIKGFNEADDNLYRGISIEAADSIDTSSKDTQNTFKEE